MMDALVYYNWQLFGMVYSSTTSGIAASKEVQHLARTLYPTYTEPNGNGEFVGNNARVLLASTSLIYHQDRVINNTESEGPLQAVKATGATITVIWVDQSDFVAVMKVAASIGMTGENRAWLVTEDMTYRISQSDTQLKEAVQGMLGFRVSLNETAYQKWKVTEMVATPAANIWSALAWDSVQVYARALDIMSAGNVDFLDGALLLAQLRKVDYTGLTGRIHFTSGGDRIMMLDFINCNNGVFAKVGSWADGYGQVVSTSVLTVPNRTLIVWPGTSNVVPTGELIGGHIAVGVLLPVAPSGSSILAISKAALLLAAAEISSSGTLLPGFTFSLDIRTVYTTKEIMDAAVLLQQNPSLNCYIGVYDSYFTEVVHPLFRYGLYPQVAFQSRSVNLDDRSKYAFLVRVAPSDIEWIRAIIEVIESLNWMRISSLYTDQPHGAEYAGVLKFESEAIKRFGESFDTGGKYAIPFDNPDISGVLAQIKQSGSSVCDIHIARLS